MEKLYRVTYQPVPVHHEHQCLNGRFLTKYIDGLFLDKLISKIENKYGKRELDIRSFLINGCFVRIDDESMTITSELKSRANNLEKYLFRLVKKVK